MCVTLTCYGKGFIAALSVQSKHRPWENQDENIFQMSGGLGTMKGSQVTDGWMDVAGLLRITKHM